METETPLFGNYWALIQGGGRVPRRKIMAVETEGRVLNLRSVLE